MDNILKQYFVRVETINDKNPEAKEIRFNNQPIWDDVRGTYQDSDKITNVEPNNVHIIKSNNNTMTGVRGITDKDSVVVESPLLVSSKTIIPQSNVSSITDDMRHDDIYPNNTVDNIEPVSIVAPTDKIKNLEQKRLLNSIPRPQNSFMRDTDVSLRRKREISNKPVTKKEFTTFGGRKSTRKNKKKTKTMRRKRRNL
jgi:hypothetical protein